ncbi:MAG: cytochrome c-type biogenesis protein CcmH [Chloroflexota bacterium]|nr:cytochrome c-type biogenesis protein CcmH [Chloroflexota bacterium]
MIKSRTNQIAIVLLVFLAAFVWLGAGPISAQDAPTAEPAGEVTLNDVNEVARDLWCPLCSGVRLDACELKACDQMKDVIAIKLAEGEDAASIKDYFIEQYGPQVLGEPPREGFNWLAWILPFVALALGGVFLWRQTARMMQPAEEMSAADPGSPPPGAEKQAEDDYARKLDEELAKYG